VRYRAETGTSEVVKLPITTWERKFEDPQAAGLVQVELTTQLGISRQKSLRCICHAPPRLVASAILGLWYQDRMGGLLETERTGRSDDAKAKRQAGKSWRQKKELKFFGENVTI
jgi:hypothetical protein